MIRHMMGERTTCEWARLTKISRLAVAFPSIGREAGIKPRPMQHSPRWPGTACAFSTRRIVIFHLFYISLFLNKYNHYKHIRSHVSWSAALGFPKRCFSHDRPLNTHTSLNTHTHLAEHTYLVERTHLTVTHTPPRPGHHAGMHCMSMRNGTHWAQQKQKLSFRPCSCPWYIFLP